MAITAISFAGRPIAGAGSMVTGLKGAPGV
jgi:hypothetical protein